MKAMRIYDVEYEGMRVPVRFGALTPAEAERQAREAGFVASRVVDLGTLKAFDEARVR